jgi:hypothetical protein
LAVFAKKLDAFALIPEFSAFPGLLSLKKWGKLHPTLT